MKDEERKLWNENNNVSVHKLQSYMVKFNKEKKQTSYNESVLDEWVYLIPSKSIDLSESIKPL